MKIKRVRVYDLNQKEIYKGPLLGLSYEKKAIIDTCILLFDDDSPCIIHESYAIQTLADEVEKILLEREEHTLIMDMALLNTLPMLNKIYEGYTFILEVKR